MPALLACGYWHLTHFSKDFAAALTGSWFGHLELQTVGNYMHYNFLCFRLSPVTSMVTAIPPPLMRVLALH